MSQQIRKQNPTNIRKAMQRKNLLLAAWGESIVGFRNKDLAKLCGISPAAMSMILHGVRAPSLAVALRMAPLLGMSVTEIYLCSEKAQRAAAEAADPLRRYPLPDSV